MKKSIKLTALALLVGGSLFAAAPVNAMSHASAAARDHIIFNTIPSQGGIDLLIKKNPLPAMVVIRDNDGNILWKNKMRANKATHWAYNLTSLSEGDYSIEITSGQEVFKRNIHIYYEGPVRTFIVQQVV